MKNETKTMKHSIGELVEMRRRISELKAFEIGQIQPLEGRA